MPSFAPPRARSAAGRSVESTANNAKALPRSGGITVVEVVAAGKAALPARRPRGALDPVRRLAGLLEAMAAQGSDAIDELSFRKAVEALAPASRSAMASDLACFAEFCDETRCIAMPAAPATIVAYIDHLEQLVIGPAQSPIKPATIVRRLGSIASAHALMGHRQLVAVGRVERRDAGIGRNHAAIATPVTSAQCVNAWVRAERMLVALAGGGQEKTLAI